MTFDEKMEYLYEKLHELDDEEIPHEEFISKLSELLNDDSSVILSFYNTIPSDTRIKKTSEDAREMSWAFDLLNEKIVLSYMLYAPPLSSVTGSYKEDH